MFIKQQFSILELFLKDHVTLVFISLKKTMTKNDRYMTK